MQTIICGLIVIVAVVYVANRWLPPTMKQRLLPWLAKTDPEHAKPATGACGSCSTCGQCGNASTKVMKN